MHDLGLRPRSMVSSNFLHFCESALVPRPIGRRSESCLLVFVVTVVETTPGYSTVASVYPIIQDRRRKEWDPTVLNRQGSYSDPSPTSAELVVVVACRSLSSYFLTVVSEINWVQHIIDHYYATMSSKWNTRGLLSAFRLETFIVVFREGSLPLLAFSFITTFTRSAMLSNGDRMSSRVSWVNSCVVPIYTSLCLAGETFVALHIDMMIVLICSG